MPANLENSAVATGLEKVRFHSSCPDQEGRRGSGEVVRENLGVPLEGDRDVGARCGSHQGCQVEVIL